LIPHFIPILARDGTPRKRRLPSPEVTEEATASPRPQEKKKKKPDAQETYPSATVINTHEWLWSNEDVHEQDSPKHVELTPETPKRGGRKHYYHGVFKQHAAPPLPKDVTQSTRLNDFAAAEKRYTDSHQYPSGAVAKYARRVVHIEMIGGKYGIAALKPCSICVKVGATCRVYHPECYEWDFPGQGTICMLGWRCERCRRWENNMEFAGGCNAQHEA
jgi:hypothetical protein